MLGIAKSVRHQTLTLAFVGSSPATPAILFFEKERPFLFLFNKIIPFYILK